MNESVVVNYRQGERGAAQLKFLLFVLFLVVSVNAGFNYVPVAYQGESFKQEMQTIVVQGTALPTANGVTQIDAIKAKLKRAAADYQLPPATIDVKQGNNTTTAHVIYSKEVSIVPFGIYNYHYEFNHIATPTGFLTKN